MGDLLVARLRELARRAGMSRVATPVLVAGFVLLSVAVVAALIRWWPQPSSDSFVVRRAPSEATAVGRSARGSPGKAPASASGDVDSAVGSAAESASVCVHVVGAVRHPGVYVMPEGTRVEGVVDAAGGMTNAAASSAINLAAKLADGEQIVVPTEAEVKAGIVPAAVGGAGAGGGGGGVAAAPGAKVNLNSADATQLDSLPGVGPSTAAKIVSDRQSNGPFKSVDDLGRVPGIGPKKLDQLKPLVCVR